MFFSSLLSSRVVRGVKPLFSYSFCDTGAQEVRKKPHKKSNMQERNSFNFGHPSEGLRNCCEEIELKIID